MPGEHIAAREWNAVVDAFARIPVGSDRPDGSGEAPFDTNVVLCRNSTEVDLEIFSPFFIDTQNSTSLIFNPADAASLPSFQKHRPIWAEPPGGAPKIHWSVGITLDPIKDNVYGRAAIGGAIPCQVDMVNAAHRFARLKASSTTELISSVYGPVQILWRPSGTGVKWCVVSPQPFVSRMVPVRITKDGGVYGSDSTACTATYTVRDLNLVLIESAMTPRRPRGVRGEIKAISDNSFGVGFWDEVGTFFLWDAGETPNSFPALDT